MRSVSADVLDDPSYLVPEAVAAPTGIGWLRCTVSRFVNGAVHARRRALVEEILDGIGVDALRSGYDGHPVARLAVALGVDASVVDDVRIVAAAYQTGDAAADDAVERLVKAFGGVRGERTAARIQVLVQACDATAALIEQARGRRAEPPVAATRRVGPDGEVVLVPLDGHPFGAGPRACPGQQHALALVEGALSGG